MLRSFLSRSQYAAGVVRSMRTTQRYLATDIETEAEWDTKVLKSDKPVIVDFHAEWCGPCKMLAPKLETIHQEVAADAVSLVKVNVDDVPEVAGNFGITSIPSVFVFNQGKPQYSFVGLLPDAELKDFVSKAVELAKE